MQFLGLIKEYRRQKDQPGGGHCHQERRIDAAPQGERSAGNETVRSLGNEAGSDNESGPNDAKG